MPKRSNDFQRLVHLIYSQMLPVGATVSESALLTPRNGGEAREVDVLILLENPVTAIRIAVECRDRSRKDDLTWIDGIIGKYQDLDVNKVIAVSRAGFSKEATKTALSHGIHTITLRQALDTDWPKQFKRLGVVKINGIKVELKQFSVEVANAAGSMAWPVNSTVSAGDGTVVGTLGDLLQLLWRFRVKNEIVQHIDGRLKDMDLFRSFEDLKTPFMAEAVVPVGHHLSLRGADGQNHTLRAVRFRATGRLSLEDAEVDHYLFDNGKALVSRMVLGSGDAHETLSIAAVQIPDKPEITVRWEIKKRRQAPRSGKPKRSSQKGHHLRSRALKRTMEDEHAGHNAGSRVGQA